ncbi:MAG: four helix bundle protein [Acidobacteria bacterium]|nr:four helix bundle protein [Acidobacteriota bacterium]
MDLVLEVYEMTKGFPREETYGLVSQLRRAAISVPSNIAEGACNRSADQFRNFLAISIGSLNEIDTQLTLANRIGYVDGQTYSRIQALVDECLAITYGLRRSISR